MWYLRDCHNHIKMAAWSQKSGCICALQMYLLDGATSSPMLVMMCSFGPPKVTIFVGVSNHCLFCHVALANVHHCTTWQLYMQLFCLIHVTVNPVISCHSISMLVHSSAHYCYLFLAITDDVFVLFTSVLTLLWSSWTWQQHERMVTAVIIKLPPQKQGFCVMMMSVGSSVHF